MINRIIHKIPKSDYIILPFILALAFYTAFIPHQHYQYPVHVDEWVHMTCSKTLIQNGGMEGLSDPFSGKVPITNQIYEAGFHLFTGIFKQISGISWLTIFRYFPPVIFVMTVLSVYVLGKRQGFGLEAAFFTSMIPTTIGILGPAFAVPSTLGLLFIPLCLFLAFNFKNIWAYLALFILVTFLITLHGITAAILLIILAPYVLLKLKGDFKHSCALILTLVLPFVISLPWTSDMLHLQVTSLLSQHPPDMYVAYPRIMELYGYPAIVLCLIGIVSLVIKGGKSNYGLVLGLLILLVILAVYYTLGYGLTGIYQRGLIPMTLMMSIIAGAGLMWLRNPRLPALVSNYIKIPAFINIRAIENITGSLLCIAVIGVTIALTIPVRQNANYYYMINEEDFKVFKWIEQNVDEAYERAILDPWKATAFTAITGRHVYTRIHVSPTWYDEQAYTFLQNSCSDTALLIQEDISIVYTTGPVENPDLVEVGEYVYLLKDLQKLKQ